MAADVLACKFSPSPSPCPFCIWFVLIAVCFILVSCLSYYLILMMEAIHSFKTLAYFHKTTQYYIPEVKFFSQHYENFKYNTSTLLYKKEGRDRTDGETL
jgi:hypothetical protein